MNEIPIHLTAALARKSTAFCEIVRLGLNINELNQLREVAREIVENRTSSEINQLIVVVDDDGEKVLQYEGEKLNYSQVEERTGKLCVGILEYSDLVE
jgi:hypothetical protein